MNRAGAPRGTAPDVRRIVEALNGGDAEAAFTACRAALARVPRDPVLNQLAATAALRMGRHEEADRLAHQSLLVRPDHAATLVLLGRAARALARWPRAVAAFARAVELAPRSAEAAFLLPLASIEAGLPVGPLRLDLLAARFPAERAGWDDLAEALITRGEREAALPCLAASSRAAPTFAAAMRRGLLCQEMGRRVPARLAFEEAAALRPDSARAWFLLGVAAQDCREDRPAEAAYRRALALDPALAEAAVNLGALLQERRDLDGARAAYAQAVKARPDTFGRVAQALATAPRGELWLDLGGLRRDLAG